MQNTGSFAMKVNQAEKTIDMIVSGSFTPEQAQEFIKEYQQTLSAIKPEEFVLQFDCRDLNVVSQEMIPNLEACLAMYRDSGFNKVLVEIQNKPIIKLQLNRLARNVGLTNFEIAEI
jgi:hypothetical protein